MKGTTVYEFPTRAVKFIETESGRVGASGWARENRESLKGTVCLGRRENSGDGGGDGCTTVCMYLMPLNCALQKG